MNLTSVAHLHLLLNHVPTIGTVLALGLFSTSLVRRNQHLRQASLEVFFIIALATLPAYLSGVAAKGEIAGRPDVSESFMETHHDAALLAFVLIELTGAAAWLALWQFRRTSRHSTATSCVVLVLSVVTIVFITQAATLGGEIRHPEIRLSDVDSASRGMVVWGPAWMTSGSIAAFATTYQWVWPAAETLHFMGLCLTFGILLTVNLRLLGIMKAIPFPALHRLLPWGILGFSVNLVTGMLFFISTSAQYTANVPFYWKTAFLMVAGANYLYLTVADTIWTLQPGDDVAPLDKAIAASAICVWFGVLYLGRMLPFVGNAF